VLGVFASNNGTWLDVEPKPRTYAPAGLTNMPWAHYLYAGKAFMENGIKKICVEQSWGLQIPNNGWQKLDQAYFDVGGFFSATTLIYNPRSPPRRSTCSIPICISATKTPTCWPSSNCCLTTAASNLTPTGYYGPISALAVLRFQLKYQLASPVTP